MLAGTILGLMFVNAAPAQAMMLGWEIVAVYKYEATCHQIGRLWLDVGRATQYKCRWDSPGFALWVNRIDE
ncbi:hypothetical protein [Nonomuraea sp. NEAU-A123]|uniref:hypothetical protein n=1 Tax=Nonomuraea sp. NEAU-A123 TaxID=2839649 RepID=UPI001BE41F04|nr:hypothetical protein [Nonomuraea sp. NEAU-A123]MBT2232312.1 hypothetical protein [Nonomuraea sp. NEAU-A123]